MNMYSVSISMMDMFIVSIWIMNMYVLCLELDYAHINLKSIKKWFDVLNFGKSRRHDY